MTDFNDTKSVEAISIAFLTNILESSGYTVIKYGLESFSQDIIKLVNNNYKCDTNNLLRTMPDLVIVDNETKDSFLVEVKFRGNLDISKKKFPVLFTYRNVDNLIKYWSNALLVFISHEKPYLICVKIGDIDRKIHYDFEHSRDKIDVWNFDGVYQDFNKIFPKVTSELISKKIPILGLRK